jgi:uncharacterized protein YjbI with pentapeptide repeats
MRANIQELYESSIEQGESSTKIPDLDFSDQWIVGLQLSCIDFGKSDLTGTVFIDCDLRGSIFEEATTDGLRLIRCHIYECYFPQHASSILFEDCCKDLCWKLPNKNLMKIT